MRLNGTVAVTVTADQGQPAAAVCGFTGSDILLRVQVHADPMVGTGAAIVGKVVNAELEVDTVLDGLLLLGLHGHEGGGILVVGRNDGEAFVGILVTGLGLVNVGLCTLFGGLFGIIVLVGRAISGPVALNVSSAGTNSSQGKYTGSAAKMSASDGRNRPTRDPARKKRSRNRPCALSALCVPEDRSFVFILQQLCNLCRGNYNLHNCVVVTIYYNFAK